jgi:hypothetical protein
MTLDEERARAAEARVGARLMRQYPFTNGWSRNQLAFVASSVASGEMRNDQAPESVVEAWPIYRAAMGLDQPEGKGARK